MKSRVIVSAVIEKGEYLLFGKKEKDRGPYPNKMLILGGGVNLGKETCEEAVKREAKEEAGIEIEIVEELGFDEDFEPDKNGEMTHYLFIIFRAEYLSGEIKPGDDIAELTWIHKDRISGLSLCRPSIRLFKKIGYLR